MATTAMPASLVWGIFAAAAVAVGVPAIGAYTAHRLAIADRPPVVGNPGDLGLAYEDVSFRARDGLLLRGWYVPAQPVEASKTVVILHGQNANRADGYIKLLPLTADLVRSGYNVLGYDSRGHGQSEGAYRTFGDKERHDLKGAIDFLEARGDPGRWVGVIGFSLGAGTAMMTAPEEPRIRAVVADSGYADIGELVQDALPGQSGLPPVFTPVVIQVAKLFVGDVDAVKPERVIGRIAPRPMLIVHGAVDDTVPLTHAYRLARAYPEAELWVLDGVNHVAAYANQPREYLRRVLATFARAP